MLLVEFEFICDDDCLCHGRFGSVVFYQSCVMFVCLYHVYFGSVVFIRVVCDSVCLCCVRLDSLYHHKMIFGCIMLVGIVELVACCRIC